jgi:hypothetical protein
LSYPRSGGLFGALLSITLLATLAGCGTEASDGAGIVYDPCQPTFLLLGAAATSAQRTAVADALALWRLAGGPHLLVADEAGAQVLPIGFQAAAPLFFGLYRPDRGDILINSELGDARARAITLAHELGHAFGLPHVTGRQSLMNPGNLQIPPASADSQLIYDRRPACAVVPAGS